MNQNQQKEKKNERKTRAGEGNVPAERAPYRGRRSKSRTQTVIEQVSAQPSKNEPDEHRKDKGKRKGGQMMSSTINLKETTVKAQVQACTPKDGKRGAGKKGKEKNTSLLLQSAVSHSCTMGGKARFNPSAPPLRVIPLGGIGEIGKNMTAIECGNDIIVVDSGVAFPDEDMLGVDLVIPDISYLTEHADRVRGIVITHGHEDHIGAVPYVLRTLHVPVYGTGLTIGILKNKLEEHRFVKKPELRVVSAGDIVQLGMCRVEFIHVNHSIADACAIAIETPAGIVFHTGDFKLDVSPIDGQMMDIVRIGELGRRGVLLMLGESTNAERGGFTPSERRVGGSLETIFSATPDKRLIIATFSSNVHRVQQIIDASVRHGRKVAVLGRSMQNVIGAAVELDYMNVPEGVLIDVADMKRYRPEELTLVTTGSQGEPMSALYRMAFAEHDRVKLGIDDLVVLSSSAIPGNERLVGKVINALIKNGIRVVNDSVADVHVSGHACSEELKLMLALVRPTYFMPIHGEERHLFAHKQHAEMLGIPSNHIFISEIGKVLEIDRNGARFTGNVPSGSVMVDGSGVGDVGTVVLRDRRLLSQDGLIVVVAAVDIRGQSILSGPDLVSRGFVYVRESEELLDEAKRIATEALQDALDGGVAGWNELKMALRDELSKFFFKKTKRRPMVLPVIMGV